MSRAIGRRTGGLVKPLAQVRGKREGRHFTGPRLLIRKSLVRAQPGEPTFFGSCASGSIEPHVPAPVFVPGALGNTPTIIRKDGTSVTA